VPRDESANFLLVYDNKVCNAFVFNPAPTGYENDLFETDEDKILIRPNGSTSGEMTLRPDVLRLALSSFHYLCDSFHVLVRLQMTRLSEFFERVAGRSASTRFNAP
jgi:hypothetical protein